MKNAVIYARYNSDKQSEESIDAQVRACRDYAAIKGYNVIEVYADEAAIHLLIKRIDIKNKAVFNIQSTLSTVLGDIGCEGAQHILPEILFQYIFYIN